MDKAGSFTPNDQNSESMASITTDILILSNGPGELITWVRPVVKALRSHLACHSNQTRISIVLSPCPHATGKEVDIAQSYPEVDRVQDPKHFWRFLLLGKTAEDWNWCDRGLILFLGGDQFFCLILGKRLGYPTVVYAEWEARWYQWLQQFGVMKPEIITKVSRRYRHKFTVVGDLMADVGQNIPPANFPPPLAQKQTLVGLLPGSKPAKLMQMVPLCLGIAEHLKILRPQTTFVIPVAPTLDIFTLARYADPKQNLILKRVNGAPAELVFLPGENQSYLQTPSGLRIYLWTQFPAYGLLKHCHLCLTTVGANTAELGSLGVPMIVLLPTQQLDAMRAWDGLAGVLVHLPYIGRFFAHIINWFILRQNRHFAWPNIWAKKEIVPELVGKLDPQAIATYTNKLLGTEAKLNLQREGLREVRGESGASKRLAELALKTININIP